MRIRAVGLGVLAALALTGLIALGSRGFRWFDAALIGYAVGTIFATAAITYKYTFWLSRPPTGRYWSRSWEQFLSFANFKRYTSLIPKAIITDIFTQNFILQRGLYRWIMHQCIFWGVVTSCLITFPLTFGWLRFTQAANSEYQLWFFGVALFNFHTSSLFGVLVIHALDFTALLLLIGLVMAFYRRFHDLAAISIQRFQFDLMPIALLLIIAITGLALTFDNTYLKGAYYWYISLVHQVVVVFWLITLPFGKFFHIIERPATVGIKLYMQTAQSEQMQKCLRCGEEFATARFVADLKKTLVEVGEDYTLPESFQQTNESQASPDNRAAIWWQDFCPACKRILRGQANLASLGKNGNRFL